MPLQSRSRSCWYLPQGKTCWHEWRSAWSDKDNAGNQIMRTQNTNNAIQCRANLKMIHYLARTKMAYSSYTFTDQNLTADNYYWIWSPGPELYVGWPDVGVSRIIALLFGNMPFKSRSAPPFWYLITLKLFPIHSARFTVLWKWHWTSTRWITLKASRIMLGRTW